MTVEIVFWCSVGFVFYAYFGYLLALLALSAFRDRRVQKGRITPSVTFIVTAYNEEARIREKIENTLALEYAGRLEILVASDCSSDRTDAIVSGYGDRVRLIRAPERRGKEAAQKLAVAAASGEVLVFSDVATALPPNAIASIVGNFADPTVGCVSSIDRFVNSDGSVCGEGAYVRYEMFLRRLETRVNSLVGLSGSFFAARREVCRDWAADRQSDFNTVLNAIRLGLRGVLDPESAGFYFVNLGDDRREIERKIRTVVRALAVLERNLALLNPWRYGLFAWQLGSHKLCRWLVPVAMVAAAISNAVLVSEGPVYLATFLLQTGFYVAAAAGAWTGAGLFRVPSFFVAANLAILIAWFRYLRGERITAWRPSERPPVLPDAAVR